MIIIIIFIFYLINSDNNIVFNKMKFKYLGGR